MLDRRQYDLDMDRINKEQIDEIQKYLSKYIKLNAEMRNEKINTLDNEEALNKLMNLPFPREGRNLKDVADELVNDVFGNQTLLQHPRYLSLVATSVSPYALMASILADIYNVNTAGYKCAPAATVVEERLISFMAEKIGFDPKNATGVFTSGGSLSNLTAMIAAREDKLNQNKDLPIAVAYCSDQAHSSIVKGMKMMGLRPDQIKVIPTDEKYKIRIDLLEEEIVKDINNGCKPFLIVGTCGTTNTGSVDPFRKMAEIAQKYDCWFHIDGAYGGSIMFSDIYKNLGAGAELADSFSWDTHKWSLQPYACSTVIAKDKQKWITAFNEHPEYLEDVRNNEHLDGWDRGIEMSRPFRAVKLWATIQALGTDKLADIIDYSFYNCKLMRDELLKKDYWEIVVPPCCAALNFRVAPKGVDPSLYGEMTHKISEIINDSGYAYILTTTLRDVRCMRVCLINGNTTAEDILNTVEYLNKIAELVIEEYKNKASPIHKRIYG